MGRRKKVKTDTLFSQKEHEKNCIDYLRENGYGVFKLTSLKKQEEEEVIRRLESSGYIIKHVQDQLTKIDPSKISSSDEIVYYFYEKLKRHSSSHYSWKKSRDQDTINVGKSVINRLINWRVTDAGLSLSDAITEVFIMIDILFDKVDEWKISVESIGILSISKNKPFVISLLNEVQKEKDKEITYKVDNLIESDERENYLAFLNQCRLEMQSASREKPNVKKRKIGIGVDNGEKIS